MISEKAKLMQNRVLFLLRKEILFILALVFIYTGCEKEPNSQYNNNLLTVSIGFDSFNKSKSGEMPSNIVNVNLFVFDQSQDLIKFVYLNNGGCTTIKIKPGISTIAAIANVGNCDFSWCNTLSLLRESTNNSMFGTGGNIVFTGEVTHSFSSSSKNIIVPLTQMLSKITYVFDKTNLDPGVNIIITKIQLMNTPTECNYLSPNMPYSSRIECIGDALEGSSLEPLNHDSAIPLYMFENMQGTIGSSSNPQTKHPGLKEDVCTYVEITADYSSPDKIGTIKYKNFLGSNTTNNYDIARGNHYQETIQFNGTSINEISWRVDITNLHDKPPTTIPVTEITLDYSNLKLINGNQHQLQATIYPLNATNPDYTWYSSNPSIVSVNLTTGLLTASHYGEATVTVKSCDGAYEATCVVNVYDPIDLYVGQALTTQYFHDTGLIESCEVILFLRANIDRPSNMSIIQALEPFISINITYSYRVKGTTYNSSGNLTLDYIQNCDYPYKGIAGTHEIISFVYPLSEPELLAAIGTISYSISHGSAYIGNWYVTW